MIFKAKDDSFYLDDQKVFLNSGEIHYFRIKYDLWDTHLLAAREAGLTTVSTYVPWAWHEPVEGFFDFEGKTKPERNLKEWLNKCKEYGLNAILKPGPFILAEFRGAGLPDWFLEKHGDSVRMRNSGGEKVMSDGVNLFHPIFLNNVEIWYDNVMPFIKGFQSPQGGPVIMMQLCNEIGVFSWLAHQADYGEGVRERFIAFTRGKFQSIDEVNRLWETDYPNFDALELPPDGRLPYQSRGDRSRDYHWHCFWREYYGDYLKMLDKMVRDRGITVPLYHNLPGWIYGHGFDFPLNITMYQELYGNKSEILFGIDHIPEFVSFRNMHDDGIINAITRAMQGPKPLFAAEFQSGSREYHVIPNPREMELFYKASIINGLTGWNYYMFSQGRNPARKGYSGDTFYWFTPVTAEGKYTNAFGLVKKMSHLVGSLEKIIVNSKRRADVGVLFDPPYYATELERPEEGASNLQFVPAAIRRSAYFDGLLRALQVLNVDFDMVDLTQTNVDELIKYRQVWLFSTDEMDVNHQQTAVDYAKAGGRLAIFPYLPDREMSQKPCSIIRDELGIAPLGVEIIDSPLIDILKLKDVKCANPQVVYSHEQFAEGEVIACTLQGSVCGFTKPMGKGKVLHLGTWLGFDTERHKEVYQSLLDKLGGVTRHATSDNEFLSVKQRFTESNEALLFVGNYFNEEHCGCVRYTHPETNEQISLPYSGRDILWPPTYALLSPICLSIDEKLSILHTTSDIQRVNANGEAIDIFVVGDRDLAGEMVLEGKRVNGIKSVQINNEEIMANRYRDRILINYSHAHREPVRITINF